MHFFELSSLHEIVLHRKFIGRANDDDAVLLFSPAYDRTSNTQSANQARNMFCATFPSLAPVVGLMG